MHSVETPMFSVITAVWNDRAGLQSTASSLHSQTCRNFEWIVIDGASTDGTAEWIRDNCPLGTWVSEKDKGIADAWNKGIARARGRFILILNAADTYSPSFLDRMSSVAPDDKITCCHARLVGNAGEPLGLMMAKPRSLWRGMHLPHNWCVVPRRFYEELGGYPLLKYSMDFAWFHRYFKKYGPHGFLVVPEELGDYHMGGISDRGFRQGFVQNEKILREHGLNAIVAMSLRAAYTANHTVTSWRRTKTSTQAAKIRTREDKSLSQSAATVWIVLATLRTCGGNFEALRLAAELRMRGVDARVLSLWKHPHPIPFGDIPVFYLSTMRPQKARAPFDIMVLLVKFFCLISRQNASDDDTSPFVITTHFSTLLFGGLLPAEKHYNFLQDLEWLFVPKGMLRSALSLFIRKALRRSNVISANAYLSDQCKQLNLRPAGEASIWCSPEFALLGKDEPRIFDVAMILRHGHTKRLDLYLQLLDRLHGEVRVAVITPEEAILAKVSGSVEVCLLRPSRETISQIFHQSITFISLSDHEGFGLPPLEAMSCGCIPICRDAKGIRCFMKGPLEENIFPLGSSLEKIVIFLKRLLGDTSRLSFLSSEAVKMYQSGGTEAMSKRASCLDELSHVFLQRKLPPANS